MIREGEFPDFLKKSGNWSADLSLLIILDRVITLDESLIEPTSECRFLADKLMP